MSEHHDGEEHNVLRDSRDSRDTGSGSRPGGEGGGGADGEDGFTLGGPRGRDAERGEYYEPDRDGIDSDS